MTSVSILALLAAALLTATISGVFGMAGGLILMGVLTLILPVSAAMVTHGLMQMVANGSRAMLHRHHIAWPIVAWTAAGGVAALLGLGTLAFSPSMAWVNAALAGVAFMVWLPTNRLTLDAQKRAHALLCGLSVTGLNIAAGVAGPLLDVFFVKTALTRHQIVATEICPKVGDAPRQAAFETCLIPSLNTTP